MINLKFPLRGLVLAVPFAFGLLPTPAPAQHVAAIVNGEPITAWDIEQRRKLIQLSTNKAPERKTVIDELIDEKLKVREAKRWTLEASDADVEQAYATIANRMRLTPAQLTQNLARSGVDASTLKARVRADIVWSQLVRGRFSSSLNVVDKDVLAALASKNDAEKDAVGYDYSLRPILFLVPPGSAPAVFQARKKEAEALRARFRDCDEGIRIARALREVAVRDVMNRSSVDLPADTRKLLDGVPVGHLTPPEIARHGVEMFAVCAKHQTTAETPGKRQVRNEMVAKRFEDRSKLYLQQLRRSAMIEYR
jgi:peptidyl-prolyl cis-trans isomerase SurA